MTQSKFIGRSKTVIVGGAFILFGIFFPAVGVPAWLTGGAMLLLRLITNKGVSLKLKKEGK